MAGHVLTLVLAVAIAIAPVQGGNRAWESPINYDHITHVTLFGDPALQMSGNSTAMGGNSTTLAGNSSIAHTNSKRWMTIKPGDEEAQVERWPGGVITYCFDDTKYLHGGVMKSTREILFADLIEARNLWFQSGLTEGFDWKEPENPNDCNDETKRPGILKIYYSDSGKMATTLGVPAIVKGSTVGPRMILSDSDMGMLNIVANYAHEMGHAWGLHHEHQNQRFWGAPYSEAGGTLFGTNNWNCRNLKDYDTVYANILKVEGIASIADKKMALACQNRAAAAKEKFSAYDYLPVVDEPVLASNKDIDWDSIMLYPSGAGALGTVDNGVDNRQNILTKPNGDKIAVKIRPSGRDVDGLKKLYGYKTSTTWTSLGDKASRFADKFKNIRKKEPDSGCQ